MVVEILEEILEFIKAEEVLQKIISVFIITLSIIYIPGRLLNLTSSPRVKNILALISILTFTPLLVLKLIPMEFLHLLVVTSIGIVVYTLLGMRIFDRVDTLLSKTIGPSSYTEEEGHKHKKKHKKSKKVN